MTNTRFGTIIATFITSLGLFTPAFAFAAIVQDDIANGTVASPPSNTVLSTNSTLVLVTKQGTTPTSITFDGASLTKYEEFIGSGTYGVSMWVLENPSVGTFSPVFTGGSGEVVTYVLSGGDNATPDHSNSGGGSATCGVSTSVATGGYSVVSAGFDNFTSVTGWASDFNSNGGQFQVGHAFTSGTVNYDAASPSECIIGHLTFAPSGGGGGGGTTTATSTSITAPSMLAWGVLWLGTFLAVVISLSLL